MSIQPAANVLNSQVKRMTNGSRDGCLGGGGGGVRFRVLLLVAVPLFAVFARVPPVARVEGG
jgi:hypothetical protein